MNYERDVSLSQRREDEQAVIRKGAGLILFGLGMVFALMLPPLAYYAWPLPFVLGAAVWAWGLTNTVKDKPHCKRG